MKLLSGTVFHAAQRGTMVVLTFESVNEITTIVAIRALSCGAVFLQNEI